MLRFCCSCSKSNHFDSHYQILSSLVLLMLEEKVLQVFLMWAPKQARSSTEPSFSAKNWFNSVGNIDRNLLLSGSDPFFSSLGLINKPLLPLWFYLNLFSLSLLSYIIMHTAQSDASWRWKQKGFINPLSLVRKINLTENYSNRKKHLLSFFLQKSEKCTTPLSTCEPLTTLKFLVKCHKT